MDSELPVELARPKDNGIAERLAATSSEDGG